MERGFSVLIISKGNGLNVVKERDISFEKIPVALYATLLKEEALGFKPPSRVKLIPRIKEKS